MQGGREEVVTAICRRTLGAAPTAVRKPPTGNSKRTALVALADGREVVVQYRDRPFDAEAAVTRAVAERTDVPVAPVLAAGRLDAPPVSYLVTGRVAGADLHERFVDADPDTRERLARTLGRYLATVHEAFAFDACGRVAPREGDADDGPALTVAEPLSPRAFYREYLDRALADWPDALADLEPRVEAALDARLDGLPAAEPRLFPWDYRPGNTIVREADGALTVAAVLDWDDPLAAPAGLSAAKAEFTLCDWYVRADARVRALRAAYRAGYREVRPFPTEGYDALRLLGMVASAADARGEVTRPRYPPVGVEAATAFHRERLESVLSGLGARA